jgi:hypothetical protein
MNTHPMSRQRGQAMSELIAAMAFLLPVALGAIYLGKYSDIKHQAVQASRYAALERAMDPNGHESDGVIGDETVARFFRDGGKHTIGYEDRALGNTAGDENPNWSQIPGAPMIAQYSDIGVRRRSSVSLSTPVDAPAGTYFGLTAGSGVKAEVAVSVAPIAHFDVLNRALTLSASTVMAGDPWNGGGGPDVAGHIGVAAVPAKSASSLVTLLDVLVAPLTSTPAPQFGCVKPDVVPKDASPGAFPSYNPLADPSSSDDPNHCYN